MKFLIVSLVVFLATNLLAQGRIFIPEPPRGISSSPVNLKSVNATIQLKEGIGNITLEETFFNPSNFRLEGEYIFALPGESQIHDFFLYINGNKTAGEILDGTEAAKIYEGIVRKMRDPALLEYAGNSLFKARIFPIEPKADRKIELSYAQTVSYDGNVYKFSLPIKQSGQGSIEKFYMSINLQTNSTLGNIYSPSHQIHIVRENDNLAKITLEATNMEADKDLVLYYTLKQNDINATLLTFRPRTDRDGYFMLLASPGYDIEDEEYIPKDVIFVIDVSGSMAGEKIQQAKEALKFCVNTLKPNDSFEIISFSTSLNSFQNELKNAGKDEIENALYFIDNLNSSGGTNIDEALKKALRIKKINDKRPTSIVFLTDGLPTEGETSIKKILQNIKSEKKEFIRIFSFGVGFDVNTFLLDKISQDSHGSANYVKPGEDIEKEVSTFFAKISNPVMTSPKLDFAKAGVYDVFPQELPDIFKGQRVSAIGRYRNPGEFDVLLTGMQKKQLKKYEYNLQFKRRESDNDFIAKLWANRKVSHLLMQLRFNGENQELVESIKQLGKEYGIVTPYTSYLVTEQEKELAAINDRVRQGGGGVVEIRMQGQQRARKIQAEENEESVGSQVYYDAVMAAPRAASNASGKGAVLSSRAMKKIANAEKDEAMIITVKRIFDRTFNLKSGVWVESDLTGDINPDRKIKFLSDEYFNLVKESDELRKILSLGEEIIFKWDGEVYIIVNK